MMKMERWEPIKDFETRYLISDTGKVMSLVTNQLISKNRKTKDGYMKVTLRKDGKAHDFRIHRLVALHFIENPHNKETVNHKDGDKTNNHVDNLEWATREEQVQHSYDLGLKKAHRGHTNKNAKLTEEQVKDIRRSYQKHSKGPNSSVQLAKKYGVSHRVILMIVKNQSYV